MRDKQAKNTRTLDMYVRLCEGKVINKEEEAERFGVDKRSIQRDIDDIRSFLAERSANGSTEHRTIESDRKRNGYVMKGCEDPLMSNSEILAVSKILLESRAFTKKEINSILDKMIAGCVPMSNMKLVSDLIANEKFHYVELRNQSCIQDRLWELGTDIKEQNCLEIEYQKQAGKSDTVTRIIEPVAILFSEYYFYLNAYIVEKDAQGNYIQKYDFPAIYRIDRIQSYRKTGEHFVITYAGRFEEGDFRKRVQFMYAGKLTRIQLRYTGKNVDAILDRLPTAEIISQDSMGYTIRAEVYGKGILMWLLSQGNAVEVLSPASLRDEMRSILLEMLEKYKTT